MEQTQNNTQELDSRVAFCIFLISSQIEEQEHITRSLPKYYQVRCFDSSQKALIAQEQEQNLAVIICDQKVHDECAFEFFQQSKVVAPNVIRIMIVNWGESEQLCEKFDQIELFNFVARPFDIMELVYMAKRGVEAFVMRRELMELNQSLKSDVDFHMQALQAKNQHLEETLRELEQLNVTDQLTGAFNRRFFDTQVRTEIHKLKREMLKLEEHSDLHIGLFLLDVDDFKAINDKFGHRAGDKVLCQFVSTLKSLCRDSDWIIRWGGEEFIIIVRDIAESEMQGLARRLIERFKEEEFVLTSTTTITVQFSMGLVSIPMCDPEAMTLDLDEILDLADQALYSVKQSGKNGWLYLNEFQLSNNATSLNKDKIIVSEQIQAGNMQYISSDEERVWFF